MDGTVITRDETSTISLNSGVGIVYKIFGDMVDILLEHGVEFLPMKRSTVSKEPKKGLERDAQLTASFHQYVKEFNRDELEEASRCSARNLQVTLMDKDNERFKALDLLEHANDNGEWIYAFEQYRSMFFHAMYDSLYDEADEHLEALRRISENLSGVTLDLKPLTQLEEIVQDQRSLYMLTASLFSSEAGGRQDALEIAQKIRRSMAEIAPEQFSLAERHCAMIKKSEGSGTYPTQVSIELFMKLTRKHGKKQRDPTWVVSLMGTMESFAKFITNAYDAMKAKEFDSFLEYLNLTDELMEKEEFLHDIMSKRPETFKGIREACERGSIVFESLPKLRSAITRGDFEAAWSYVEDISKFQGPPKQDWLCADDIATIRVQRKHTWNSLCRMRSLPKISRIVARFTSKS